MTFILRNIFIVLCSLFSLGLAALSLSVTDYSNTPRSKPNNFVVSEDVFGTRNFIENKGQFKSSDVPELKGDSILFLLDNVFEKIYFTSKGLLYEINEPLKISEEQMEQMQEEGKTLKAYNSYFVHMNWINADPSQLIVEAADKQSHYFTYGEAKYNAYAFKKIIYKNVFKGIDIEYTFPKGKSTGIKYAYIVHPGADANLIKFTYTGDVKKIKQTEIGEIIIKTPYDDLLEHLPQSFQNETGVQSEFKLENDVIGFNLPNDYDHSKSLIIDPWVSAITTLSTNNAAYDVDYDFGGNTYIYGGTNTGGNGRCKVAMYNTTGVLQWTFSGIIISPAWNSGTIWSSNFKVNRGLGKAYVTRNIGPPNVVRLDASGNYDNLIANGALTLSEVWNIEFTCSGDVLVFGGNQTSFELVSATTGSVTMLSTFNPLITGCCQDVVAAAVDASGNTFIYFLGHTLLNNVIAKVTTSPAATVWTASSGFSSLVYLQNKNLYVGASAGAAVAFNALAVNMNYLYYYDGSNLAAYNKTNGSMVTSTTVAGLTARVQGGIAVDDCDNIYLGGNGDVRCFHFNGTSFSTLTPIALNASVTNQYVYDIQYNKFTNSLFVGGSGFVGTYSAIYSSTCSPALVLNPCNFGQGAVTVASTSITCANLGSATVSAIGGLGPYSYTWMPTAQTGSVVSGLSPGTYSISVFDSGTNYSFGTAVLFTPLVPLTGNLNWTTALTCYGDSIGTANILALSGGSGSQSYLWTGNTFSASTPSVNGLSAGNYSVTVTDALTGCIFTQSFAILQPLAMNLFMSVSSPTACVGDSITVAGMNTGGSPPYTYTWTAGPPSSTYQVTHALGGSYTYTLNSTDNVGCPISSIATITFVPRPSLSVSNVSICPFAVGTFTALGASSYTWLASTTLSNQGTTYTASPLTNTQYTLIGTALGCTSVAYPNMILKPVPSVSFSSNSPICNGQNLQLIATGGSSYVWSGPLSFTSPASSPLLAGASPGASGVYQFTATAVNACTAATSGTVTVYPTPTLSALGSTVCSTQILSLTANSFAGATYVWSGPLNFNSVQQTPFIYSPLVQASGNYTVKATSVQGCTNTAVANVTVTGMPAAGIISNSPRCFGETLNLTGTGGLFYSWSGPNGFSSTNQNPQINNVTVPAAGVYTLVITTGPCVASTTKTITVYALPQPTATNNGPLCQTKTLILHASNGGVYYNWSGPNFANFNQHPAPLDSMKLSNAGVYTVVVTDNHGCVNLTTTTVTVMQNPTITAIGATVCLNDTAVLKAQGANTYLWYGPNNYSYNKANAIIKSATSVAPTIYTVVGTAVNTCSDITTVKLATIPLPIPSLTAKPKTRLCLKETLLLEGFGGLSYDWQSPGSLLYSGKTISVNLVSMAYAGDYTLTVWDMNACHNSTSIAIQMDDLPNGNLGGTNMQACVPFKSEFNFYSASNISSVKTTWQLDGKVFASKTFSYNFVKAGDYPIMGEYLDTLTNCRNTGSFVVNAYALPLANYTYSPEKPVESVDDVIFTNTSKGENQKSWTWFFMDNNPIKSNKEQITYLFKDEGIYPVVMIVKNGWGCSDTVVKAIKVEADFNIYVPNAFTPNGDGINEVFMPVLRGVKYYHLSIFDRWGAELFESVEISNGWDGTFNTVNCKQDVYVWKIKVSANNGQEKEITGHVSLYR